MTELDLPFLCAFSDGDPITAAMETVLRERMPGAAGREHPRITDAGHFLQEDAGPEPAAEVVRFRAEAGPPRTGRTPEVPR